MLIKSWGSLEKDGVMEPGHIRYSVLIVGSHDKLLALRADNDEEEEQKDEDPENAKKRANIQELVPGAPPIIKKSYQMTINIYQGDFCELKWIKDYNLKCKIIVTEGTHHTETVYINNSQQPAWKDQFSIPIKSPFYLSFIVVEVWYYQLTDRLLGRFYLDFEHLVKEGTIDDKWFLIYGPEREDGFFKRLKYQYRLGTDTEYHFYLGKVLCSAKLVEDEFPMKGKLGAPEVLSPKEILYIFWLDIYELTSKMLSSSDSIFIEVQVGNYSKCCQYPPRYNSDFKKFFWKGKKEIRFAECEVSLPKDVSQIPDIFIRVIRKGGMLSDEQHLAYCRFNPNLLLEKKEIVKPSWEKIRMTKTELRDETDENFLGFLLCSINFFQKESNNPRPVIVETGNYKKYKLVSIIYMANNLPVNTSGNLPYPKVQIFFNGKYKGTKKNLEATLDPEWGEVMYITTYLNDCLDLADDIKLDLIDTDGIDKVIGSLRVRVNSIPKYNSQAYIENDIFKYANWYNLYENIDVNKMLDAKILAAFLIVKLTKQGKEVISLKNKNVWPKLDKFRMYFLVMGVRNVPKSLNLKNCFIQYTDSRSSNQLTFNLQNKQEIYNNNINVNLANIPNNYILIDNFTEKDFRKPVSVVLSNGNTNFLTAKLDYSNSQSDINKEIEDADQGNQNGKIKQKKKNRNFNANPDDYLPIYKMNCSDTFEHEYNNNLYKKTISEFPFELDEVNTIVGDQIRLYVNRPDFSKKGKRDEDSNSNYDRPEIDKEYENELGTDLKFSTAPLIMSLNDHSKNQGIIRYKLDMVKESEAILLEKTIQEFKEFRAELDKFRKNEEKNFLCRIYLLNTSNLTPDDSSEEAFVWIKRYESDTEWKDERTFSVSIGDINQMYPLILRYPETFFLTLQIHTTKKIIGLFSSTTVIGETIIDLERRYFHSIYQNKLKEFKTFKQIPIESRTLFQNKQAKGAIRMWIELLPRSREDLTAERLMAFTMPEKYELRLIIWNARNVPCIDGGKVDIMVKVSFNDGFKDIEQETDIHSNSKDGNGEFNWRVVIPFQYPNSKVGNVAISVYDYNSIASNEMIGSNVINIKKYLGRVQRTKTTLEFPRDWLNMKVSNGIMSKGTYETAGDIELEFKLLTFQEAESLKVGLGRNEPNKDPFLEMPKEGRDWLDKFSFIGDLLSGLGSLYGNLFKWIKIFGIIITLCIVAYVVTTLTK